MSNNNAQYSLHGLIVNIMYRDFPPHIHSIFQRTAYQLSSNSRKKVCKELRLSIHI